MQMTKNRMMATLKWAIRLMLITPNSDVESGPDSILTLEMMWLKLRMIFRQTRQNNNIAH